MASSDTMVASSATAEEEHATLRRVAVSSFLGNFIEWFDYASYSYFATVIALVFFPASNPTVALMETFAVFALSFLMRPVGAFFWGHMGDKKGRKWALATSILLMTGATFCIGLLPTFATVGLLAPALLLLLRMVQSFSASGEYAGAATFLAEYAPANHRGLYCSLVPASTATGLLVGSTLATLMFVSFGHDSAFVTEWGWRIPFLLAGPLGIITHYIRTRVSDSPVYQEMQDKLEAKGETDDTPIKLLFTKYWKPLLVSFGACMLNAVGFYAVLTYLPNYLQDTIGYDAGASSLITTICLVAYIAFIFLSGRVSDRFGRKKMLIIASIGFIVFTVPAFMLMGSQNFWIILVVELVMCLLLTINDGTLSSYLSETFPTEVRYSGFAVSFNFANAIFGGSASFISIALIEATGNAIAPAWYMVAISVIALIAMCLTHDNSKKKLTDIQ
ncbi:MAG: MFS transporter [Adlercreutzia sp.]|nr:MFS transporter [Adlercreutzia sp.]